MVTPDALARAALDGESLLLRSLAQDFIRDHSRFVDITMPLTDDPQILGTAAALVELRAERAGQLPPNWTHQIGAVPHPVHLLKSTATMPRLRAMCEVESPEPLRKRGLYAPREYLSFD